MLNFTYDSNAVMGQFNGRFVFRASADSSPMPMATFSELSKDANTVETDETLKHEYYHWLVFRHSREGIKLIGRRFRARKAFINNDLDEVKAYYKARTCYFVSTYDKHENVVKSLIRENKVKNSAITANNKKLLLTADCTAVNLMRKLKLKQNTLNNCIDYVKGSIVTKEYGLQTYFPLNAAEVKLYETSILSSTKGVINSAFVPTGKDDNNFIALLKRIRRAFNAEGKTGLLSTKNLSLWTLLKLKTELTTLREIAELYPNLLTGIPDDIYHSECCRMVSFILRHTLSRKDVLYHRLLSARFFEIASSDIESTQVQDEIEDLEKLGEPFLYFFYTHGN